MRALVVVSVLAVLAVAFVVYALVDDSQKGRTLAAQCPEGWPVVDLTLKKSEDIKINVFNATDDVGRAGSVGSDFANRKFQVLKKGNSKTAVDGVAVIRFGPQAVASAHVIRAYFLDEADTEYDPARKDDVVDVIIGDQFKQLATTTEVNQSLVELASQGEPKLPPQTCPAP
ncbi:LytR C-terminal domain-containing protein [Asanoa hainanensis]|uniref:LytR C-terminal domain-containing protein n=1 Tax=Asanoa hainanensis TaxID=560556 RepID=UPI0015C5C1B4|nr:LytR C-terminal domain-containing protein [Asanoa hainanensis]